jgi:hypothetical protein
MIVRRKLNIGKFTPVIGFFGKNSSNEYDRKGIDVLVEGIFELKRSLQDLAVLIIGPGWQALSNQLKSAGVNCIWIPFVAELSGLKEMYHALDFYWVTARIEGGPVTLLEAMSAEVCCLTTPVGIAREIVRDGENALLLPFDDPVAFANRTLDLWSDPDARRRMGESARETILLQMDVGITSVGVKNVYHRACQNFANRKQSSLVVDFDDLPNGFGSLGEVGGNPADFVPLAGFRPSLHRRIKTMESLAWSEHLLLYQRQRAVATRIMLGQWLKNPASLLPLRMLLRSFLPAKLVKRIVEFRKGKRPQLDSFAA